VAEEGHERGQVDAAVEQGGAVGVAQMVRGDPPRRAVATVQAGVGDGALEAAPQAVAA
jgi:hypothetical protein